jgi:hypothetical protein
MARLRQALVGLSLVLALLVAAAVIWRAALVGAAANLLLSAQGLDEARFEVAEVGLRTVVLENLVLGEGLPRARRVRLGFEPLELLGGRLGGLRVEGLRYDAPADWRAALLPLAAGASGAGWVSLPRIEIVDAVVAIAAPAAGTIAVDGALDLTGARPGAALDVAIDLAHVAGRFALTSEAIGKGGAVEIGGAGELELAGLTLPGAAGVTATGGRGRFTLEGTVRIPAGGTGGEALRGRNVLALKGELALAGLTTSAAAGMLSLDMGWVLNGGDGTLRLALPRPARLTLAGAPPGLIVPPGPAAGGATAPDLIAELAAAEPLLTWSPHANGGAAGLSAEIALELGEARGAVRLSATAEHDAAWRLVAPAPLAIEAEAAGLWLAAQGAAAELRRALWSTTGSLQPDGTIVLGGPMAVEAAGLAVAGVQVDAASAWGDLRLTGRPGDWSVSTAPGLAATADGAAMPGRLELAGPLRLAVDEMTLALGGGAARLGLRAIVEPFGGTLGGTGGAVAFAEASGRIRVLASLGERLEGEITVEDGRVVLPGQAAALDSLSVGWPLGGLAGAGGVALSGNLHDTGRSARFAPVQFALAGERDADAVAFSGTAAASGGVVRLPIAGSLDLASLTGRATVGPTRIRFRPGGLQPAALSPRLAALRDVAGAVRVSAEAALDATGALRTSASLTFEDLAARTGDVELAGLAGRLRLGRLAPPVSAGPQELTARQITAGVPLEQPRIRFSLEPGRRGPRLLIHEATAGLSGGTVAVADARWDSGAETNAFTVQVRDVPLGRLLSDWRIEGISGSGRLSGEVPVRFVPAGIAIEGGRLAAAGPGVIQVDWGAARETLVGSAEQVALAVRALEDFRYKELTVGLAQPPGGDLTLAIGLEGANPAVLEGYPFRFNITLSGQLAPILEALREGRRIGAGLLRGGLGSP